MTSPTPSRPDIIIVGGSVAGLTAAMTLGRAKRRVLVLDSGLPANRYTPHSHNLFTRDGEAPAELLRLARAQALAYPTVQFEAATVTAAEPLADGFRLTLADGAARTARTLLLATGVVDDLSAWPELAACWGRTVVHCPYCHGYELPAGPLGAVGNGDMGFDYIRLLYTWNPDLRLFTNGPAALPPDAAAKLAARGVDVIETPIAALDHADGHLRAVVLADGRRVPLGGLYYRPPFALSGSLAAQLGCALTEMGHIRVDAMGVTTVPGVFAAGDCTTPMRSLNNAAAEGNRAAAMLNHQLAHADF